jgi:regulator of extracellular matrix RemA (YlzA/DUF370 family)
MPSPLIFIAGALIALVAAALGLRAFKKARGRVAQREKQRMAEATARRHARVIEESKKIIARSKNPELIASRFDVIRDHAEKLSALSEHYDLPNLPEAKPQDLKTFCKSKKDQVLRDSIISQIEDAMAKAEATPKWTGKITCLEKALLLVLEGRRTMRDEDLLRELEIRNRDIQGAIGRIIRTAPDERPSAEE